MSLPQAEFLLDDRRELFYGGAVGGGKSDALLMAALQYVDVPGYAALLLRRTFAELSKSDGLIPRAAEWLSGTDARKGEGGKLWTFPSGARLEFGHVQNESDKHNYQSAAYQFVGFDELTSFSETIYDYIGFTRTRRRMTGPLSRVPIRVRAASNPGNVGHLWVKRRYIDEKSRKPGAKFIPAKVHDNPGLDVAEVVAGMVDLPDALRRQLLEGDWGAFEGAAFAVGEPHLIDSFPAQDAMNRFEAADYGFAGAPWAYVVVDFEGNLVFLDMLYEKDLTPAQIAPLVIAKRKGSWGFGQPAFMDPSVWHRTGTLKFGVPAMLSDEFGDNGVPIVKGNNDPRAGMARMRELLRTDGGRRFPPWHPRAGEEGSPQVFFHRTDCARLIEELQGAPLQPIEKADGGEKVDSDWEHLHGHAVAMARYAVMSRPSPNAEPLLPIDDPDENRRWLQQEMLREADERWEARVDGRPIYSI